jgi:hypothetical protein
MSAKPLAEAYEMLKELRRQGELQSPSADELTMTAFESVVRQGVPGFPDLSGKLDRFDAADAPGQTADVIRLLEIKPLAERIFGDERIADAWLNRANRSFSGQRPIDLLKDELGTAVVREALEQIDHGIFS